MSKSHLPAEFVAYFVRLCNQSMRCSTREAWCRVVNQWRALSGGFANSPIPGYPETPKPSERTGLPVGWSYYNLIRFVPKSAEQLTLNGICVGTPANPSNESKQ